MKKCGNKRRRVLCGLLLAAITLAGSAAFLFYGPFEQFRRLWIHTAVYSSHYKFLATALYPQSYIDRVLDTPFPQGATDPEPLEESPSDTVQFAELKGNYYRGYIIKIEDPRRLNLVPAWEEGGSLLETLVAERQCLGGVNGGGYRDDKRRGLPWGTVIIGGELVSACTEHREHTIGGLTRDYKLAVGRMGEQEIRDQRYEWAFEFGPVLIMNGEKTALNSYSGGLAPRSAIGQTREGHILLVVVDGRQASSIGATYQDIQTILYANGAINAIELDGGSSSCMVYQGKLVNSPSEGTDGRLLPNAIIFK
ncbi:exopolysaccharide biosynthesis protein [Spirochaetia bacterium]|nr:exopolysaccharide biosynthesis protein [Spirochaetia bacterium]